jgi:spore maturation protein SpmB
VVVLRFSTSVCAPAPCLSAHLRSVMRVWSTLRGERACVAVLACLSSSACRAVSVRLIALLILCSLAQRHAHTQRLLW